MRRVRRVAWEPTLRQCVCAGLVPVQVGSKRGSHHTALTLDNGRAVEEAVVHDVLLEDVVPVGRAGERAASGNRGGAVSTRAWVEPVLAAHAGQRGAGREGVLQHEREDVVDDPCNIETSQGGCSRRHA